MSGHVLHLVRDVAAAEPFVAADARGGAAVRVVLLHDAVRHLGAVARSGEPEVTVAACADDLRRRGLSGGSAALEYADLVEWISGASRVVCW